MMRSRAISAARAICLAYPDHLMLLVSALPRLTSIVYRHALRRHEQEIRCAAVTVALGR